MRKLLIPFLQVAGLLSIASTAHSSPIEYTKICSNYGAGFFYIPGSDVCVHALTRDARQQTPGGTWRSVVPYSEGEWISNPAPECQGNLVKVGSFKSTDFTLEVHGKKVTPPTNVPVTQNQFVSKVMMSGGFYDPRIPGRHGVNGGVFSPADGLCVRTADPNILVPTTGDPEVPLEHPEYGNGTVGCVANSRIVGMPGVYSISATYAYPQIRFVQVDAAGHTLGPFVTGSQLFVATDVGPIGPKLLTYCDAAAGSCDGGDFVPDDKTFTPLGAGVKPLAGTLNVWACVETGK